jgi:hypothetical protein
MFHNAHQITSIHQAFPSLLSGVHDGLTVHRRHSIGFPQIRHTGVHDVTSRTQLCRDRALEERCRQNQK